MRLNKAQREKLLTWVAEGLQTDEINRKSSVWEDPFTVTRQMVDYYRKSVKIEFQVIKSADENSALKKGYAIKEARVKALNDIAEKLIKDLLDNDLTWTEDVKMIGSGPQSERIEFEEFNRAEIEALRGIFDDIAKEVGDRSQKHELSGPEGGDINVKMVEVILPLEDDE